MARRKKTTNDPLMTKRQWEALRQTESRRQYREVEVAEDPDYESMGLEEYSGRVQQGTRDCVELLIGEAFNAADAAEKGDTIGAVKSGATAGAAGFVLVYTFATIFEAVLGSRRR